MTTDTERIGELREAAYTALNADWREEDQPTGEQVETIIGVVLQRLRERGDQPIDLNFYAWREWTTDASGDQRLLVPWSDPQLYEYPADGISATVEEALEYREQIGAQDEGWVLVHYVGTQVTVEGEG
jgi:hypothetical protein